MTAWTLVDLDNRGDSGEPYELTDKPKRLVPYLDQVVRKDLAPLGCSADLDDLIAAFRAGDLAAASRRGTALGIYVYEATR